ncbi:hypothetical protein DV515_00008548 [Chloebia gouldiae]|uniref:Short coiled-coil protein n=1 Tax=Chloebia gouldiae TaxID=44316 RepID=A0A3L8SEG5_CHLGU|nr:hypothetical protein DV515_00008548 [Chloebia gouldiae]
MELPLDEEDGTFTSISLADDSERPTSEDRCFEHWRRMAQSERTRNTIPLAFRGDVTGGRAEYCSRKPSSKVERVPTTMMNADMDAVEAENQVELEEKTRLINQVLELQHTLEDLSARVDAVKEENLKLKSENQVLGQYIENLMSASSVFQTTDTKSKRK